jgi:predicted TIM-barrel fold metal-dependent hydrolase
MSANIDVNKISNLNERISSEVQSLMDDEKLRFDVHCHIFNRNYIPDKYLGLRFPFITNEVVLNVFETALRLLFPFTSRDKLDRLALFLNFANHDSMKEIAADLINLYNPKTIFCPLMMDLLPGIGKKQPHSFDQQMDEMQVIRDSFPDKILPFVALDPQNGRENTIARFEKAFSQPYNFFGVKIYPALGYMPSHPVLMEIFKVCEEKQIPITTHCGGDTVHTQHNNLLVEYQTFENNTLVTKSETKHFLHRKYFADYFNKPENWTPVLHAYPNLKLNFGHFGGLSEWEDYSPNVVNRVNTILDFMDNYPNVYSDISFIYPEKNGLDFIKTFTNFYNSNEVFRNKTIYGSDFYMIYSSRKFKNSQENLLGS